MMVPRMRPFCESRSGLADIPISFWFATTVTLAMVLHCDPGSPMRGMSWSSLRMQIFNFASPSWAIYSPKLRAVTWWRAIASRELIRHIAVSWAGSGASE